MKTVVLTIGPRGAGKTTFCREVVRERPEVALVERDAILLQHFGSVYTDLAYEQFVRFEIFEQVRCLLAREDAVILLDAWTMSALDRREMVNALRALGADRVVGWHFVTPEEEVVRQFLARENNSSSPCRHVTAEQYLLECRRYRAHPVELEQGFDGLVEINPMQQCLFPLGDGFFR